MKIIEFFLIIWGKLSELDPEPEFLTSWSRSWGRTKIDRLRNTASRSWYFLAEFHSSGGFFILAELFIPVCGITVPPVDSSSTSWYQ
jgi:hypothetical protein